MTAGAVPWILKVVADPVGAAGGEEVPVQVGAVRELQDHPLQRVGRLPVRAVELEIHAERMRSVVKAPRAIRRMRRPYLRIAPNWPRIARKSDTGPSSSGYCC
jgi:hypothetical protein